MSNRIGERLRFARLVKHMTMQDVADNAGISKAAVHNFESGRKSPNSTRLISFCKALGVPPDYFFTADISGIKLEVDKESYYIVTAKQYQKITGFTDRGETE